MDSSKLVKVVIVLISLDILGTIRCLPLGNFGSYNYSYPSQRSLNVYDDTESDSYSKYGRQTLPPASQVYISTLNVASNNYAPLKQSEVRPFLPSNNRAVQAMKDYSNYYSQSTNTGYNHRIIFNDNDNSVIDYDTTTDSSESTTLDEDIDIRLAAPVVATLLGR